MLLGEVGKKGRARLESGDECVPVHVLLVVHRGAVQEGQGLGGRVGGHPHPLLPQGPLVHKPLHLVVAHIVRRHAKLSDPVPYRTGDGEHQRLLPAAAEALGRLALHPHLDAQWGHVNVRRVRGFRAGRRFAPGEEARLPEECEAADRREVDAQLARPVPRRQHLAGLVGQDGRARRRHDGLPDDSLQLLGLRAHASYTRGVGVKSRRALPLAHSARYGGRHGRRQLDALEPLRQAIHGCGAVVCAAQGGELHPLLPDYACDSGGWPHGPAAGDLRSDPGKGQRHGKCKRNPAVQKSLAL
mmetsp:Transcript_127993/g.398557  ORF Transcript_127993/g.398557 Transcript_127993/m.398557 type:complete len:300 (-) Transcript_127993:7-906(-)